MNVTLAPAQIAPAGFAAILTAATKFGFTVIVIGEDVAGLPVAQAKLEVITQVIISLLFNVASE